MRKHPRKHEKLTPFDIAAILASDEAIAECLSQVIEDGDSKEFIRAPGHIAKARGVFDTIRRLAWRRE